MQNLKAFYHKYYYISPLDLADAAETNRLHVYYVSILFFFFGFLDLLALLIMYWNNLSSHIVSIFYFAICTVINLLAFILAKKFKDVEREKAYYLKNIPFYLVFFWGLMAGTYNFYVLGQPFNGMLTYLITESIAMAAFSLPPDVYFLTLLAGLTPMLPGIYRNFHITGTMDAIFIALVFFCLSLYKRSTEKKYIMLLKKQKQNLEVKTFGNFTILYNGKVIKFSRSKSTELLAYLIYKNGSSVQTKELINVLYGEHADSARYGASIRNLISDIRHTVSELEIQNFFIVEYNNFRINPEIVHCDYYNFLSGDKNAVKKFNGEFMNQFSWAEDVTAFLQQKILFKS